MAEVYVADVNVWDEVTELGAISKTTGQNTSSDAKLRTKNYISIRPNTTYYFKGGTGADLFWYRADGTFISATSGQAQNATFTTPSDACYLRFALFSGYGTTYNNDISINYPSTDTDYHAYSGTTTSITFPSTVYGGTLTVNEDGTGTVVSEWAMITLNGSESWTKPDNCFKTESVHADSDYPQAISNTYIVATSYAGVNGTDKRIAANSTWLRIHDESFATADALKTYLLSNNVQYCYQLATPITITLTPGQVNALLGNNTVWVDDSGEIKVTFRSN